jgi:hypothetical protein
MKVSMFKLLVMVINKTTKLMHWLLLILFVSLIAFVVTCLTA